MRHHRREAIAGRKAHGVEGLGERADLVHLDEESIRSGLVDASLEARWVRDEEVVADDLDTVADGAREVNPPGPVVLRHRILDRYKREVSEE